MNCRGETVTVLKGERVTVLKERKNIHYFPAFPAANCYKGNELPNNLVFRVIMIFRNTNKKNSFVF